MQAVVATIVSDADDYAREVAAKLKAAGIRVETDLRNEKINYKVREHSLAKVPHLLVVGKREAEEGTVALRRLGSDEHQKMMSVEDAVSDDRRRGGSAGPSAQLMPLVLPGHEVKLNEPGRRFERHHHLTAYAALVVSGTCHEAGDGGRFDVEAGDVLIHRAFDGHRDSVGQTRCRVHQYPGNGADRLLHRPVCPMLTQLFARSSATLPRAKPCFATSSLQPIAGCDWPDLLAATLASAGANSLQHWAEKHRLHPASSEPRLQARVRRLAQALSARSLRKQGRSASQGGLCEARRYCR